MRSFPSWTCLSALGCLALLAAPARAQPCCSGASALFPARLGGGDWAVLGLALEQKLELGSFDSRGAWTPAPAGSVELGLQQRLFGAWRVAGGLQVSATLPVVETWRRTSLESGLGGGVGDVQLAARYDFLYAGNPDHAPGVAALASFAAPTGIPADAARLPLAADATGQGAWQGNLGFALEEFVGANLVFELTGAVTGRTPRNVGGVHAQLAPQVSGALSAAWLFEGLQSVALTFSFSGEPDATVDGVVAPRSGRRLASVGLFGAVPLPHGLRLTGALGFDLPISGLSQGQSAGLSLTVVLLRLL